MVIINNITTTLLLAYVYMPVDPGCQQDEDFEFICGCLDALITDSNTCGYILAGDFNFRPNSSRHNFVLNSLSSHRAITANICIMNASNYTYVSHYHNTTSWLDHIVVNNNLLNVISGMSVECDIISSDHRLLTFELVATVINNNNCVRASINNDIVTVSEWDACSIDDFSNYAAGMDFLLRNTAMPSLCGVNNCADHDHKIHIITYYESISQCIREAMQRFIPSKRIKHSEYTVAGWNDIVAEKHEADRRAFLEMISDGKPKMGYLYEIMKRTRAQFKLALRYCRNAVSYTHLTLPTNREV